MPTDPTTPAAIAEQRAERQRRFVYLQLIEWGGFTHEEARPVLEDTGPPVEYDQ